MRAATCGARRDEQVTSDDEVTGELRRCDEFDGAPRNGWGRALVDKDTAVNYKPQTVKTLVSYSVVGSLAALTVALAAPEVSAQQREGGFLRGGLGVGVGQQFDVAGVHPLVLGLAGTIAVGAFVFSPQIAAEVHVDAMGGIDLIRPFGDRPLQGGANGVIRVYSESRREGGFAFGGAGVAFATRNDYETEAAQMGPGAVAGAGWEDRWEKGGTWGVAGWYSPRFLTSGGFGFAHSVQMAVYLTVPLGE